MVKELNLSVIESLLGEVEDGLINIDAQDRLSKENPNLPSSLEHSKSLLHRANDTLDVEIPTRSFKNSSEIYTYLNLSLRELAGFYTSSPMPPSIGDTRMILY